MKWIKLMLITAMVVMVVGCDSSKGTVTIPGYDDAKTISVKFEVDDTSYSDMAANAYMEVTLKVDDPDVSPLRIALGERYSLQRDYTYVITGYYINTSNLPVAFPNESFTLGIYGEDIKSMTVIRHSQRLVLDIQS